MKTLEFKLTLTLAQQQTIDLWLDSLRWIWNEGLSLLEESQQRKWRERNPIESDIEAVTWYWHRNADNSYGLACECAAYDRKAEALYPVCKLRTKLDAVEPGKHFWKPATNEATPDKPWLHGICSRFRLGVTDSLLKAWKAYKDPKHLGRKPQYKKKRDKLRTLTNKNGKTTVKFTRVGNSDNAYVKFPRLGTAIVKGFYKRYQGQEYSVVRIVKEPSGDYSRLQVYEVQ
jgi:putative transposase